MQKLWTTSEVAKFLGVDELDVEQLVKDGRLTGYKLGGQFLRFRPDQVETLQSVVRFRPTRSKKTLSGKGSLFKRFFNFCYFYDFYIISASLLAVLVVYLVASW